MMKIKFKMNPIEYLSISLVFNKMSYMDIDKIYKEDSSRYSHLALQSEYMQLPQFNEMSVTQKLYFIKALGIILGRCHFDAEEQSIEFDEAFRSSVQKYIKFAEKFLAFEDILEDAQNKEIEKLRDLSTVPFAISNLDHKYLFGKRTI